MLRLPLTQTSMTCCLPHNPGVFFGAPLSDDTIARIIGQEDGIRLARRTVAKYRDQLRIPSSVDRRRRAMVA